MERDVACELWRKAPQSGVKFSIYVGDDDSTTLADIKTKSLMVLRNGLMLFTPRDPLILDYTILETTSKDQIVQFSVQRLQITSPSASVFVSAKMWEILNL